MDDVIDLTEEMSEEKKKAVIDWFLSTLKPPLGVDISSGEDYTVRVTVENGPFKVLAIERVSGCR